jgi:hypothetical protein
MTVYLPETSSRAIGAKAPPTGDRLEATALCQPGARRPQKTADKADEHALDVVQQPAGRSTTRASRKGVRKAPWLHPQREDSFAWLAANSPALTPFQHQLPGRLVAIMRPQSTAACRFYRHRMNFHPPLRKSRWKKTKSGNGLSYGDGKAFEAPVRYQNRTRCRATVLLIPFRH